MKRSGPTQRINSFDLVPGRVIGGRYVVERPLGRGWEGEVYQVVEKQTGVHRAAKIFFPHRNERDRVVRSYAQKLDRLRQCSLVIQYHHSVSFRFRGHEMTCLLSELVDGELLTKLVAAQPGKRLHPYEAMHILYGLASGLEQIHLQGEYHGDLHDDNILIARRGIDFDLKLIDFFHAGGAMREGQRDDIVKLIRVFYDVVGGRDRYARQPDHVKQICCGLRRDLILRRFPTATKLCAHLASFDWNM